MDNEKQFSRRDFLVKGALAGAGVVGLASLLVACGKRPEEAAGDSAAPSCDDVSALSDTEKATRTQMVGTLKYVEVSAVSGQNCANCQLYKLPAAGSACGGCQLFPGPVAPGGHCMSWAQKVS